MKHKVENQRTSWAMYLRSAIVLILTGTASVAISQPTLAHTKFDPNSPTEPNTLVAVGNRVWHDINNDGVLNDSEIGIGRVAIHLYKDTNGSGLFDLGDTFVSAQTSSNGGFYGFNGLVQSLKPTERYLIVIDGSNFCAGGALQEFVSSTGNVGGDSDLNNTDHGIDNPAPACNISVSSSAVTLLYRNEPTNDGDTDPNTNLTLDFGFYKPAHVTVTPTQTSTATPTSKPVHTATSTPTATPVPAHTAVATETATPEPPIVTPTASPELLTATPTSLPPTATPTTAATATATSTPQPLETFPPPATSTPAPPLLSGLGNYVWIDADKDGLQSPAELGIAGISVTLLSGNTVLSTTRTGITGSYTFLQLQPGSYTVCFSLPNGYTFTVPGTDSNNPNSDQDSNANRSTGCSQPVTLLAGEYNPTIDAGVYANPTAILLSQFEAQTSSQAGKAVVRVRWQSSLETNTFGFQVLRSTSSNMADAIVLNDSLIAAQGRNGGASYEWSDTAADPTQTYYYWLRETELSGNRLSYGPVTNAIASSSGQTQDIKQTSSTAMNVMAGGVVLPNSPGNTQQTASTSTTVADSAQTARAAPSAGAVVVTVQPNVTATPLDPMPTLSPQGSSANAVAATQHSDGIKVEKTLGNPLRKIEVASNSAHFDAPQPSTQRSKSVIVATSDVAERAGSAKADIQQQNVTNVAMAVNSAPVIVEKNPQALHWEQETQRLIKTLTGGVGLATLGGILIALALMRRRMS